MYWEKIIGAFNFDNIYSDMILKYNNATFVELGTFNGRSAVFMAEKIKESGKNIKFYTIDISWPDDIEKNLEPVKGYVTPIHGSSHILYKKFPDESIDFLFIDADHSYEAVKKDLELWYPKVKHGGVISGHDYTEPCGVKMAVDAFFTFTNVGVSRTSWIYNKI